MTEPEQIAGFLRKNKPKSFCDDCITSELGLTRRQRAARVTNPLGLTSDYVREKGTCTVCKNDRPKFVIHAVGAGSAASS